MIAAWIVAALVALTMVGAQAWGFATGHFWQEGSALMSMPWGVVSIIDVYAGAALFAGWVAFRERSVAKTLGWMAFTFVGGNLATAVYALVALGSSRRDWERFWMGRGARSG